MSSKRDRKNNIKIIFICRSLELGGSERQLVVLAKGLAKNNFDVHVCVFYPGGLLENELMESGVALHSLNKKGRWDTFAFVWRAVKLIKNERPQIVHGYLVDANLLTLFFKKILPETRLVWGVRASKVDWKQYDSLSRIIFSLSCKLARFADLIIANSYAGKIYHEKNGYPEEKMTVVTNGIDTERYKPDTAARTRIRTEWEIADYEILIGMVGRMDPMKDYPTFLKAAAVLVRECNSIRFVCIGDGKPAYRRKLYDIAGALKLDRCVLWPGSRNDMSAIYNALDILTLSSCGEGFPNVVGEAMACGKICVVTDVGDAARIVGETGKVVPPKSPELLAGGWQEVIKMPQSMKELNERKARQRIIELFGIDALVRNTTQILDSISHR